MKKVLLLFFVFVLLSNANAQKLDHSKKINGVSFVAPAKEIGNEEIAKPKEKVNANYLSLMPYAFIPKNSTELKYNSEWQWWGEKKEGTLTIIRRAHDLGYKVMLKPHVWKRHGAFTGHHAYEKEEDWKAFEASYKAYILDFAKLAESEKVEIFCIGTEWGKFVEERPRFWKKLIIEIRTVYSGKLTYAANWDEYKKVTFWKELDFIGVDAYFPLIEDITPAKEKIKFALLPYTSDMRIISNTFNRPILFTEFGYRSRDKTTFKPWESDDQEKVNLEGQNNAYNAFFEILWTQNFVAGGFIWKWFADHENVGGVENNGYTPQNKPVEKIILQWY